MHPSDEADAFAEQMEGVLDALDLAAGRRLSDREMADALNERGTPTRRENGHWHRSTIQALRKRIEIVSGRQAEGDLQMLRFKWPDPPEMKR